MTKNSLVRFRARAKADGGATDPILIIAGIAITLILLVGGSFAVSGFIGNAHDLNAKTDLDRAATAQDAYLVANDRYGQYLDGPHTDAYKATLPVDDPAIATSTQLTDGSAIGFEQSAGSDLIVLPHRAGGNGQWVWTAFIHSETGEYFMRNSNSTAIVSLGTNPVIPSDWNEFNLAPAAAAVTRGTVASTLATLVTIVNDY